MSRAEAKWWPVAVTAALAVLALAVSVGVRAAQPIDDSGTWVRSPSVALRWSGAAVKSVDRYQMSGATYVNVRLNVGPWLHKYGRIYLVLPTQAPGRLRAVWTTQGRLQPGDVVAGNRMLVYSGPIQSARIEDQWALTIFVDGRRLQRTQDIEFRFEMEAR